MAVASSQELTESIPDSRNVGPVLDQTGWKFSCAGVAAVVNMQSLQAGVQSILDQTEYNSHGFLTSCTNTDGIEVTQVASDLSNASSTDIFFLL